MIKLLHKNILILIFTIYTFSLLASTIDSKINFFEGTWKEVLEEGRKQNKLIFMTATAKWSKPSEYMEQNIFVDEKVAEFYNKNFIPYKIDITKTEGEKLFYGYNGTKLPSFIFVDKDENFIYKKEGEFTAQGMIQIGQNATVIHDLKRKYRNGDRSPEFIKEYITTLEGIADLTASKLAQLYFKSLKDEELLNKENFRFMLSYPRIFKSREFQYFLRNVEAFHKKFGKDCLILVDRVFNELFEKSIKNRDKKKLDEIVNVFAKVKKIIPEELDLAQLKEQLYERYDTIIYKKEQKK